jgi:hypothetical protein
VIGQDLDWARLVEWAERWHLLAREEREVLLEAKVAGQIEGDVSQGTWARLAAQGFLVEPGSARKPSTSVAFHPWQKLLRAVRRVDPLKGEAQRAVRAYLLEHLSVEERQGLIGSTYTPHAATALTEQVCRAGHVRGFLRSEVPLAWFRERVSVSRWSHVRLPGDGSPFVNDAKEATEVGQVVEALIAAGRALRPEDLALELSSLPRERLGWAVRAALRHVLVFVRLDRELRLTLFVWEPVAERLRSKSAAAPAPVQPLETFCLAFRCEDLTHVLVSAAEPLRLKRSGRALYAAVERNLEAGLQPVPAWMGGPQGFADTQPTARIRHAVYLGQVLGMLSSRRSDGGLELVATERAWQWLERDGKERLRSLLDLHRPLPTRDEAIEDPFLAALRAVDSSFDDDDSGLVRAVQLEFERIGRGPAFEWAADGRVAREAVVAFGTLRPGTAVELGAFLRFQASKAESWLAELAALEAYSPYSWRTQGEEELEQRWLQALSTVLAEHLLPFGGVRLGTLPGQGWTIELTSIGRYVLGLAEDFEHEIAPAGDRPAIVQPDFEVVFTAPSLAHEAAIGRLAERTGRGVGALFRITRAAVQASAQAGLDAESALEILRRASARELPANVVHELRSWYAACRRLQFENVQLIRCPDADTAARVLAAAGRGNLEALSDTLLALTDRSRRAAVVRACRKAGLFLSGDSVPEPRSARRGRRWSR